MIDAYMHVGEPRFGSAAEALATCDTWGIHRAVLVLGLDVYASLLSAYLRRNRPGETLTFDEFLVERLRGSL